MNFKLTPLMAAAAIATALSSHAMAAPVTVLAGDTADLNGSAFQLATSSRATLVYSNGDDFDGQNLDKLGGAVGMMAVAGLQVRDINGFGIEQSYVPDEFGDLHRTGIRAGLHVNSQTIDDGTGQILSVSTSGVEHIGTRISGTLTGGVATVTNLRFDLVNHRVYADLTGTKGPVGTRPSVSYNLPNTALWTIGSVSGPTAIDPGALALTGQARIDALVAGGLTYEGDDVFSARIVASELRMTLAGFDFWKNSLGLLSTGVGGFTAVNEEGWGSTTLNLTFSLPAVPEPSTYALAAVGLLVVSGALRQRRHARHARAESPVNRRIP